MIYLDNAATTQIDPEVLQLLNTCLQEFFGNPSSSHELGKDAAELLSLARTNIAQSLGISPVEVLFTASATESINIIVNSLASENRPFIFCPSEHPAVIQSINLFVPLERQHEISIGSDGRPDFLHIQELLKKYPQAALCLMDAHNESGLINDIDLAYSLIQQNDGLLLCDTTQSIVKFRSDLNELKAYSVASAHKFHGPKGIGLLIVPESLSLKPLMGGGGQERGLRPGTENVAFAIAIAKAIETYDRDKMNCINNISAWRNIIVNHIKEWFPEVRIIGDGESAVLPHILTLAFPDTDYYRSIPDWLSECDIAISKGSACKSSNDHKSEFMQAIGLDNHFLLRISFGRFNTDADINELMNALLDFKNDKIQHPN